jgi:hypothetical protein
MNAARITAALALLGGYLVAALSQDEPGPYLVGFAVPTWLALEACWRLLDPKR